MGTFKGGFAPEEYVRVGSVVELYGYTAPIPAVGEQSYQDAELGSEKPFPMGGGPWTVSVPVDASVGVPAKCLVAVQTTHAFMASGNAGS
ncbi:MAG: hypothetical protein ACRDX8_10755 [Acidimicrobiales bacterium]